MLALVVTCLYFIPLFVIVFLLKVFSFLCGRHGRTAGLVFRAFVCPSVRPSVCPIPAPNSKTGLERPKLVSMFPKTGVPIFTVKRQSLVLPDVSDSRIMTCLIRAYCVFGLCLNYCRSLLYLRYSWQWPLQSWELLLLCVLRVVHVQQFTAYLCWGWLREYVGSRVLLVQVSQPAGWYLPSRRQCPVVEGGRPKAQRLHLLSTLSFLHRYQNLKNAKNHQTKVTVQ